MNKYLYDLDIDMSEKNKSNIILTIGDYTSEIVDNKINNNRFIHLYIIILYKKYNNNFYIYS